MGCTQLTGKIPYVIEAQGTDFFQHGKKQMPPAALCLFLGSKVCSLEKKTTRFCHSDVVTDTGRI